jgi:hypothetical protein
MRACRVALSLLAVAAATGAIGVSSAAADFDFTFDSNNQGWLSNQGSDTASPANWSSNAGNPGGALSLTDGSATGLSYWTSPVPAATDFSGHYGGTLSIDVKSSTTWNQGYSISLLGNGTQYCVPFVTPPNTTFQTFQYTLDASHLRKGNSLCVGSVTPEEVAQLLQDFRGVLLSGEDKRDSSETTVVDNIHITGGGPVPVTKVVRTLSLSYSKKKKSFKGRLLAPQDSAKCAAPQKVGVYRRKPGPDHKVGSPMTDSTGAYELKSAGKRGSYYAKVASFLSGLTTRCLAAKSTIVHLD